MTDIQHESCPDENETPERTITLHLAVIVPADVSDDAVASALNAALDEPPCSWERWQVGAVLPVTGNGTTHVVRAPRVYGNTTAELEGQALAHARKFFGPGAILALNDRYMAFPVRDGSPPETIAEAAGRTYMATIDVRGTVPQ